VRPNHRLSSGSVAVLPFARSIAGQLSGEKATSPRLLDRVRTALRTRHYSRRTEKAYVGWIRRYILFHGKRHPDAMAQREIGAFLSHLSRPCETSGPPAHRPDAR
jgi:hypothetical protein